MEIMPLDKGMNKHYRILFHDFFDHRYDVRETHKPRDVHAFFLSFIEGLGFSDFIEGPRYLQVTNNIFNNVERLCQWVLNLHVNDGKYFRYLESAAIIKCAAAAFLYTIGYHEVKDYLRLEQESLHIHGIDLERIRLFAKDIYMRLMLRFDQFLCSEVMEPIKWSELEKKEKSANRLPILRTVPPRSSNKRQKRTSAFDEPTLVTK